MRVVAAMVALVLGTSTAEAVTFSQTQYFSTGGEAFTFSFTGAPANLGGGGTLLLELKGDYSPSSGTERTVLTFGGVSGSATFGNGVIDANSIGGLGLNGFTTISTAPNDEQFSVEFLLDNALLDQVVAGGTISATLDNTPQVDLGIDGQDFNSFAISYNNDLPQIPLPPTVWLLLGSLGLFGVSRGLAARR